VTNISQVKRPVALLSELLDDQVPDYLYPLVMTARMISNFAIYKDPASSRARALRIIRNVREELDRAELQIIRQAKKDSEYAE